MSKNTITGKDYIPTGPEVIKYIGKFRFDKFNSLYKGFFKGKFEFSESDVEGIKSGTFGGSLLYSEVTRLWDKLPKVYR